MILVAVIYLHHQWLENGWLSKRKQCLQMLGMDDLGPLSIRRERGRLQLIVPSFNRSFVSLTAVTLLRGCQKRQVITVQLPGLAPTLIYLAILSWVYHPIV